MADSEGSRRRAISSGSEVAEDIIGRASQDLVFVMRFLGESQYRMMRHFQDFIRNETARRGATADVYPLLAHFIDAHAAELRDFVFAGVSLSRQFRVDEIEFLTRDTAALLRVDIWDALKNHIETAEQRFLAQAEDLPKLLSAMGMDRHPRPVQ